MFNYRAFHPDKTMNECTGLVTYTSNFAFAEDPTVLNRILTITPVIDLPIATYNLLVSHSEPYLAQSLKAFLKTGIDQKSILLQDTLKQPRGQDHFQIVANQINQNYFGQNTGTLICMSCALLGFTTFLVAAIV